MGRVGFPDSADRRTRGLVRCLPAARPLSPLGRARGGACRRLGRCRLGLGREEMQADGTVVTHLVCDETNEGGPDVAHGGWTAGVFDEVLGHVPVLSGELAVTGEPTVRY